MSTTIKAVSIENFKRIKEVNFEPDETGLTIIGGNNRQGKTSCLDAIAWALGGAKFEPTSPNRDNEQAKISITLSNGLLAQRAGKNGAIKIVDPTGKKGTQELLNSLVSLLALDLPKFMDASDKDKGNILLGILGIKDQLDALDNKIQCLYDERTQIGRVADALKKHAGEMPCYDDAPEKEVSASTIIAKQQEAVAYNNANADKRREYIELGERISQGEHKLELFDGESKELEDKTKKDLALAVSNYNFICENNDLQIATLKKQIADYEDGKLKAKKKLDDTVSQLNESSEKRNEQRKSMRNSAVSIVEGYKTHYAELKAGIDKLTDIDLTKFKADIEALEMTNSKVRANAEHDKAKKEANAKQVEYDSLTAKIEEARNNRWALIDHVKMPLDGLTIKDGFIYYKGKRWDCMSGAEQLVVGTSIVRSVNPSCGFVLMDKLEAMDLSTLETFNEWLKHEGLQVIATRVSKGNECAIVIEDGMVDSVLKQ